MTELRAGRAGQLIGQALAVLVAGTVLGTVCVGVTLAIVWLFALA